MSEATTSTLPQPEMPSSLRLIATLGLISMISGLLIVLTFQFTKPIIAQNEQDAMGKAVFTVLPDAVTRVNYRLDENGLVQLEDSQFAEANVFAGYDENGELTGLAMEAGARGYADIVKVLYGYSLESECIIGITILQSTETPGLGDKAGKDPDFLANFDCLEAKVNADGSAMANQIVTVKHGDKEHPWQIDGISGATVTSTAIGNGLRQSTDKMLPLLHQFKESLALHIEP